MEGCSPSLTASAPLAAAHPHISISVSPSHLCLARLPAHLAAARISPPLASPSPMSTRSAHISKERVFFSSKSEIWCNYCVVKLRNLNEASMSAQALKKFVEENQRLAEECTKLLDEVSRLENECSLYEHDRDALMEFANEVEDRAKQAEVRVLEVNDELGRVSKELEFYKKECDKQRGNEARLNEELQLLNERISTIENLRNTLYIFLKIDLGVFIAAVPSLLRCLPSPVDSGSSPALLPPSSSSYIAIIGCCSAVRRSGKHQPRHRFIERGLVYIPGPFGCSICESR